MSLRLIPQLLRFVAFIAFAFLLQGCDPQIAQSNMSETAASDSTLAHNQQFIENLDLGNQQDFEDANRGLVARAPNDELVNQQGDIIWNPGSYSFITGDAPDTVNPSLWRQAKLNNIRGLFKVEEGIYQLRGFDLANTTLIQSDNGWIIVDPLTTLETTAAAMEFAQQHLGEINVTGVIFTHSHADHFGGILAIMNSEEARLQGVPLIAPAGFIQEATSENIIAGPAMTRRGNYMFGDSLEHSVTGHIDAGLGKQVVFGSLSIVPPSVTVDQPQMNINVDGVDIEFFNMPGSEAPAELTFYLPKWKAFCGAEVLSHVMHNVLTLRGAKVRDALLWSDYIGQSIDRLDDVDVFFNSHHWPTWGHDRIIVQMQQQQDMYKFIHDQTLRLANLGYTPREIAEQLKLPDSLAKNFHIRGYYGTLSHNSKAVYQHYFGWYDGNPANLNPLPPEQTAIRYVEFMGGSEAILRRAGDYMAKGDYRWVGEVLNHVVFAEPDNLPAREMLAEAYRQMGYQAESGPWRDIYLSGAAELISGQVKQRFLKANSKAFLQEVPLEQFMKALSVNLDAEKAEGESLTLNVFFSERQQNFVLTIRNSVMYYQEAPFNEIADVSIKLSQDMFIGILVGEVSAIEMVGSDQLSIEGSMLKLLKFFSLLGESSDDFNIVLP
ncbi:MAG: MBL fold metallo-hydrolase [Porticoccaceae bacterium]|jgi:alkyl sulfatase BDS1-like metallo-beta-lactamase superfamily hydrolase|nr:MBL fold metallo-hydrolase [Porticoccaceae bacterium]MBT3798605.1 MBL fold metallo-hydrolase [Porticoccaceae bacterium]MBT4163256.1 MBL fold metallo-hydrolase [Porticoccaceae bacterium]MBT4591378.1 MBL fold metallo-hydrolase [Porticoccaceae bacterium]MBT5004417.1 MBL fold metallo-hydrolase [Porticoccaceae bacterium]